MSTRRIGEIVFDKWSDLPPEIRARLDQIEQFISDVDGKTTCTPVGDNRFTDDGDIDAEDAVKAVNALVEILRSRPAPAPEGWRLELKNKIDARLNDYLCGMKPDYDDSIVGFNEAWDIVRKAFAEAIAAAPPPPQGEGEDK